MGLEKMAAEKNEGELDYMSDIFVAETKPRSKEVKRLQKRKKDRKATAKSALERSNREGGLSTPISTDNKGYHLLRKMGYVPGEPLGKSGADSCSIEPIPVILKEDRLGLGRDNFIKEKQESKQLLEKQQLEVFNDHCRNMASQRRLKSDLKRMKSTCHNLDTVRGYTQPVCNWYWDNEVAEETEEDVPTDEDQLTILTNYLRSEYYYCLWCGTNYTTEAELMQYCPGDTWVEHQS